MTWFVTAANESEAAKHHYHLFLAVDFDFPSGHARVWSGCGTLVIGGNTYLGTGELGSVSSVTERSNMAFDRKTYQLSGVDPALVSEADIDGSFGRSVIEYIGFLDNDSHQLLATPEINDECEISNIRRIDGERPVIEVNCENRMVMLDQADGWRFSHEHQQQFYPTANDNGFDKMSDTALKELLWGGFRVIAGVSSSGRGPGDTHYRIR